jgi:hypothetical protein
VPAEYTTHISCFNSFFQAFHGEIFGFDSSPQSKLKIISKFWRDWAAKNALDR